MELLLLDPKLLAQNIEEYIVIDGIKNSAEFQHHQSGHKTGFHGSYDIIVNDCNSDLR